MSNYTPNPTWHDDPVHDTLVTAAALNHAEQGIATHTHTESEVTSLTADLAAKAATSHTHAESDVTSLVADLAAKPPTSRAITAGTGLTGGGDLSADRTLTVAYGTTSGTAAQGNDSRLSDTRVASNIPAADNTQEGRTLAVNGGTYTLTSDQGRVPLKRFRQSLATVDTTPLIWWAIGDSITEGFRASKLDNCYTFRLLRRLQKNSTALGRGGFGYLNTYSNLFAGSGGSDNYWTFSGAGAGGSGTAVFGGRRRVFAVNESATLSFTGTSFQIHYRQGDVTSIPFTITVDGGAPSTVTPGTTGGGNVRGVSTSSTLAHGLHTVVVAPVNPANTMIIYGATIRDGDETSGVRCYNAGLSGATSTSYLNTPGNAWTDQQTVTGDPSLVTIDLATNDYNGGINPSLTQTNLTSLIANVKAACTITPSFLLVIPAQIFVTSPTFAYTGYVAAIRAVAAADPTNVAVLDLTEFFIDVPAVGNAFTRGLINSDQIHPSDAGHTFTAQLILGRLLGIHQPLGVGEAATPDVVTLTAAQTVAGVKAFTSSPTVPTPSGTTDVANKAYVDAVGSVGTPDADATTKGKLQLAGDLGGTAASPTVPSLTGKVNNTGSEVIAGVKTFSSSPIVPTPSGTTDAANKAYVDSVGSVGTPDADATTKGKLQLAGDLGGTAASPTTPNAVKLTGPQTVAGVKTFSSEPIAPSYQATGVTGTTTGRLVGTTTLGAPTSGTFTVGDFVLDGAGSAYVCTVAGTPGTWISPTDSRSALTTGEEISPRDISLFTGCTVTSQTMRMSYFTARKSETTTQVRLISVIAAAATPTLCRIGLYSIASNGDGTLVASTTNDTALFATANTAYTKSWASSYAKVAGQRYALAVLVVTATTLPTILGPPLLGTSGSVEYGIAPRVTGQIASQADLPSTFTSAGVSNNTARYYGVILP